MLAMSRRTCNIAWWENHWCVWGPKNAGVVWQTVYTQLRWWHLIMSLCHLATFVGIFCFNRWIHNCMVLHMNIMDDLEITGSKRKYYIAIFVMAQCGTVTKPVHKFNRWMVQDWVPTPKNVLITKMKLIYEQMISLSHLVSWSKKN